MKTYTEAEEAWQSARALAWHGDAHGAAEMAVEVAAYYERSRFFVRARAAGEALDRIIPLLDAGDRAARLVWVVLDDFQLGPGEHGRLQRMLDG